MLEWLQINGVNIFLFCCFKPLKLSLKPLRFWFKKWQNEWWVMASTSAEYNISTVVFSVVFISFGALQPVTLTPSQNPLWQTIYKSFKSTIHAYTRWFIFYIVFASKKDGKNIFSNTSEWNAPFQCPREIWYSWKIQNIILNEIQTKFNAQWEKKFTKPIWCCQDESFSRLKVFLIYLYFSVKKLSWSEMSGIKTRRGKIMISISEYAVFMQMRRNKNMKRSLRGFQM